MNAVYTTSEIWRIAISCHVLAELPSCDEQKKVNLNENRRACKVQETAREFDETENTFHQQLLLTESNFRKSNEIENLPFCFVSIS